MRQCSSSITLNCGVIASETRKSFPKRDCFPILLLAVRPVFSLEIRRVHFSPALILEAPPPLIFLDFLSKFDLSVLLPYSEAP